MKLCLKLSSSFKKLEDSFFNLIRNSGSLTIYSVKCKTKHYDIFLPSVGYRSNFVPNVLLLLSNHSLTHDSGNKNGQELCKKRALKALSWYKWHFFRRRVECCSCRAAEQPTLVVPGPRGPSTVHITVPRLEQEEVLTSSARGIQCWDKPRLTPLGWNARKYSQQAKKWMHLNALCNIRLINTRKLQVLLYARGQTSLLKTTRLFPVGELLAWGGDVWLQPWGPIKCLITVSHVPKWCKWG